MKTFEMRNSVFPDPEPEVFTEETAPNWLRKGGLKGSTMDNRWFWNNHVLTLNIDQEVETDFQTIKRLT